MKKPVISLPPWWKGSVDKVPDFANKELLHVRGIILRSWIDEKQTYKSTLFPYLVNDRDVTQRCFADLQKYILSVLICLNLHIQSCFSEAFKPISLLAWSFRHIITFLIFLQVVGQALVCAQNEGTCITNTYQHRAQLFLLLLPMEK